MDTLEGMGGADNLDGGASFDRASYEHATEGVTACLYDSSKNSGIDALGDKYISIENLTGSAYNDILIGDVGNNDIFGGSGDDIIEGLGGSFEKLDGEGGNDTVSYEHASSAVKASLYSYLENTLGDAAGDRLYNFENITGSSFDDTLYGDYSSNKIVGGAGDDILDARGGSDTIYANQGHDSALGGTGNDTFYVSSLVENLPTIIDGGTRDVIGDGNVLVLQGLVNNGSYSMAALAANTVNINTLNISGDSAATKLTIAAADIQHMVNSGNASELFVKADGGDTINITLSGSQDSLITTHGTHTDYTVYADATHTQQIAQIHWQTV